MQEKEIIKKNRKGPSLSPTCSDFWKVYIIQRKFTCYADDVFINNSEDNLQRLLHQCNFLTQKFIMKISIKKTKCMVANKSQLRSKL